MLLALLQQANSQSSPATIKDRDGNVYAIKLFPDGKLWMTENLNINIPGSFCYDNAEQNCKQYGRLYTWQSAQEACLALGDGWRLPTNEDWQTMVRFLVGWRRLKDSGRAAFKALQMAALQIQHPVWWRPLGRWPAYTHRSAWILWTATATDTTTAGLQPRKEWKNGESP